MGIITLGLVTSGVQQSFHVPLWVIAAGAAAISLGTTFGGWRLIRTLGGRIYRIRPVNAFASQLSSAAVILGSAALGSPVSTTHVLSSSIMGSGAAGRPNKNPLAHRPGDAADLGDDHPAFGSVFGAGIRVVSLFSHVKVTIDMIPRPERFLIPVRSAINESIQLSLVLTVG